MPGPARECWGQSQKHLYLSMAYFRLFGLLCFVFSFFSEKVQLSWSVEVVGWGVNWLRLGGDIES